MNQYDLTEKVMNDALKLLHLDGWVQNTSMVYSIDGEQIQSGGKQADIYRFDHVHVMGRCAECAIASASYDLQMDERNKLDTVLIDKDTANRIGDIQAAESLAYKMLADDIKKWYGGNGEYDVFGTKNVINQWNDKEIRTFRTVEETFLRVRRMASEEAERNRTEEDQARKDREADERRTKYWQAGSNS